MRLMRILITLASFFMLFLLAAEQKSLVVTVVGSDWEGKKYRFVSYPLNVDTSKFKFVEEDWSAARQELESMIKKKEKGLKIFKIDFFVHKERSMARENFKTYNNKNKYKKFTLTTVHMRRIQELHEKMNPEDEAVKLGPEAGEPEATTERKRPFWDIYN